MENSMRQIYDKTSILKDISDREQIILEYRRTGLLDRDKAIEKIKELRQTDAAVAVVTTERLAVSAIPFDKASDQAIVAELQMQVDILSAKLARNE